MKFQKFNAGFLFVLRVFCCFNYLLLGVFIVFDTWAMIEGRKNVTNGQPGTSHEQIKGIAVFNRYFSIER